MSIWVPPNGDNGKIDTESKETKHVQRRSKELGKAEEARSLAIEYVVSLGIRFDSHDKLRIQSNKYGAKTCS
ncbi:unnamed protein product [Dovyalis caffra]|uniref:Uncharacterized protein n=1 Tax=Dovyalis caffra TaxID=77055 RepID=A0AAV1QVX2_9ROSI|nr:unnamed protein product [Dovyalis caffra]